MPSLDEVLAGLRHNRGLIADPSAFARDAGATSWLYLCGPAFAIRVHTSTEATASRRSNPAASKPVAVAHTRAPNSTNPDSMPKIVNRGSDTPE